MRNSIKITARIGGLLYLVNIVLGFIAIGYIPGLVVVAGDATATAHNILANESLYRYGLAAHIIILLTNIPMAIIFYDLFKVVNRRASLLVVFFSLTGTAIEAVNLLNEFAPLLLLKGGTYLNAFTRDQLQSTVYTLFRLQSTGLNLALVFFGCYCVSIGYLIFRSTFLPKLVGALMATGGLCYLVNSFTGFIAPSFASHLFPYILMPSGLAELSFCLSLLVIGVNTPRWKEKAAAAAASAA